jgi:hypothetical protein
MCVRESFVLPLLICPQLPTRLILFASHTAVLGVPVPSVVLFHQGEHVVHTGELTAEAIASFVDRERFPVVLPFTMESARDIWQVRAHLHVYVLFG